MKRLLTGALCLLAWTVPVRAEDARSWDVGGTRVAIEGGEDGERLTVSRDDAEMYSLGGWRLSVREPAGASVSGGAVPQLVVFSSTGGAHCCDTLHIVELGENPRLVQSLDLGHSGADPFLQLDDDPALEIALPDWTYAYWPSNFATTPVPRVILHWDGRQYVPSARLMRAGTMLYQMQERRQPQSEEETLGAIFQDTLDMIYAGRMKAARTLLQQLLPPTAENKQLVRTFFDCKLPSSPWWPFIAGLNNLPAKPPAATCPAPVSAADSGGGGPANR